MHADAPRVVFMGTPEFAVPILRRLADMYPLAGVVTQPDKPAGRGRALTPPPVKVAAEALGIPVFQPRRVREPEALAFLGQWRPDLIITAAYGQILPRALLALPTHGCLNVHASLLPRWRGAAPIHRAVMAGDEETGVTLMRMVEALDAGPVLGARRTPIGPDEDTGAVHDRLAELGAALVAELVPRYLAGEITPVPQPEEGVTYAERIQPGDEWVPWHRSAADVHNHVRGLSPWPGAATLCEGERIKVWRTTRQNVLSIPPEAPGTLRWERGRVFVACADAWLALEEVQPAGRRRMPAAAWWQGLRRTQVRFTSPEEAAGA